MNTKLSFRLQWSKRAMALVVVAAPLQWAFASQAESALRTPVATQTATVPDFVNAPPKLKMVF